jgi:hypothetical protein
MRNMSLKAILTKIKGYQDIDYHSAGCSLAWSFWPQGFQFCTETAASGYSVFTYTARSATCADGTSQRGDVAKRT